MSAPKPISDDDAALSNILGAALGTPATSRPALSAPPASAQDTTLSRTGNTADHQEAFADGIDEGRRIERHNAAVRAGAQDDAKDERPYQWLMAVSQIKVLAAELTLAAETMGGDDDESADIELILTAAKPGTVQDDDGESNATPILTVHLAEYPEEGVYPIDPCDPTGGRIDTPAPAAGDALEWQGLTDAERDGYVGELLDYGTDFVAPLYSVVESIEKRLCQKNAAQQSKGGEA